MENSIQDYLRKINSRLSSFDTVSIAITAVFLLLFSGYLVWHAKTAQKEVVYLTEHSDRQSAKTSSQPFGSKSGVTYTYVWCQGSDMIKPENVIYYKNATDAELSGRRLSKLCQK